MAAPEFSEFNQKKQYGSGGSRPATGTRGAKAPATPYRCPSWGNSTKAKGVGWGGGVTKVPVHPKSKGV